MASPFAQASSPPPFALARTIPPTRHPTKTRRAYSVHNSDVGMVPTLTPDVSPELLVNSQQHQERHACLYEAEGGRAGQRLIARRLILDESEAKASLPTLLEHPISLVRKLLE